MTAKRKYYFDGEEIDEEDALTEEGIIKDGVSVHTPVTLRDSLGRRLVDAAGQSLSDFPARRSGYVFVDTNREIREQNRELQKAELSNRWRGGLQQGDHVVLGGTRFEVLGYNSEDRMVLADASDVDPDELKRQAYNDGVAAMTDAWKKKGSPDDEDEDGDEEKERKRKRKDREFELAGPLSDSAAAEIKREALEQSIREMEDAWKTRR